MVNFHNSESFHDEIDHYKLLEKLSLFGPTFHSANSIEIYGEKYIVYIFKIFHGNLRDKKAYACDG